MARTLFAVTAVLAVALCGVVAQQSSTSTPEDQLTFARLNLWAEVNSTGATIFQTCVQQQRQLNASAAAIGANCTINGSCTAFNCTASDGTTRLSVTSNICVPSMSRRIIGNPQLAEAVGDFTLTSFDPQNSWTAAQSSSATGTGFYNVTGTQGSFVYNNTMYFPAQFCSSQNRAFRVGASWRVNVDDRITQSMNWTEAIDIQIRNAVNVSGACTDITTDSAYTQFTCNVPASNGSTPLQGVAGPIVASFQPCQREYLVFIANQPFWFSPNARVNYTVPGTNRTTANLTRTQGARVTGATQNWTSTNPPVPVGPQGNVPMFQVINPQIIKWTYSLFYNSSNVSFVAAAVYGPANACQWQNGVSSNAVAGIVTGGILFLGFCFVILFAIFGKYL